MRPKSSSRKRPRPTRSWPTRRSAASTTASAMPACRTRRGGRAGFDPTIFADFSDIFSGLGDVFGFGDLFGGRRRRGGPQRGADLRYDLEITFEESATGTETTIQIPREEACETCSGSGARRARAPRPARSAGLRPAALSAGLPDRRAAVSELPRHRARRSPSRARPAAAPAGSAASGRSRSRFPPASPPGSGSACTAKASTAPPADRPATSTSSCTSRSTRSSIARETTSTAS